MKIIGHFLNEQRIDILAVQSKSVNHCIIAKHVNEAWDSAGILMYGFDRLWQKNAGIAGSELETICNILLAFTQRERTKVMTQRDPLF